MQRYSYQSIIPQQQTDNEDVKKYNFTKENLPTPPQGEAELRQRQQGWRAETTYFGHVGQHEGEKEKIKQG